MEINGKKPDERGPSCFISKHLIFLCTVNLRAYSKSFESKWVKSPRKKLLS